MDQTGTCYAHLLLETSQLTGFAPGESTTWVFNFETGKAPDPLKLRGHNVPGAFSIAKKIETGPQHFRFGLGFGGFHQWGYPKMDGF